MSVTELRKLKNSEIEQRRELWITKGFCAIWKKEVIFLIL